MSTKIEWTNFLPGYKGETWNPIIGCSPVSPGCKNCYAEKMALRLMHMPHTDYYQFVLDNNKEDDPDKFKNIAKWNGQTHFVKSALTKPAKWKKPRAVFVCSMGDLFHESVSFEKIDAVYSVMSDCDQHIYIVLTKRPERMKAFYDWKSSINNIEWRAKDNVWTGVTAENQKEADKRIPILLNIPAAIRFVSIEPMLNSIDLTSIVYDDLEIINVLSGKTKPYNCLVNKLDWVIVGGESGHNARPMHPDWVKSIKDQCEKAGTPFFFKQWGEWSNERTFNPRLKRFSFCDEGKPYNDSIDLETWEGRNFTTMSKVGKKIAGRLIDGKEYNEYPTMINK